MALTSSKSTASIIDMANMVLISSESTASITDLPTEIIMKHVLDYLPSKDVYSFGMAGNRRLKEISDKVISGRGKSKVKGNKMFRLLSLFCYFVLR
jgi:hypothetical protein